LVRLEKPLVSDFITEAEPLHPNADSNLCIFQCLALLQILVLVDEGGEAGVGVKLVRVRCRVLRLLERHDLLATNLIVLLPKLAMASIRCYNGTNIGVEILEPVILLLLLRSSR
jgi:hypothetical protein